MIRALTAAVLISIAITACGGADSDNRSAATNRSAGAPTAAPPAPPPLADKVRVRLETEAGAIVVELDGRHAPITTANFLAYVDRQRFDGTTFYRAAPTRGAPGRGLIQGGIRRDARRTLRRQAGAGQTGRTAASSATGCCRPLSMQCHRAHANAPHSRHISHAPPQRGGGLFRSLPLAASHPVVDAASSFHCASR